MIFSVSELPWYGVSRGKDMRMSPRPAVFWVIVAFLIIDLFFFFVGQTASLLAYDFTVRWGLQESVEAVGEYGVQVNRSFGLADSLVGVPLIVLSLVGLLLGRRWSLTSLAAFMGLTLYWTTCTSGMLLFLPGVPGYNLAPGIGYWIVFAVHIAFALWTLFLIASRGETIISTR